MIDYPLNKGWREEVKAGRAALQSVGTQLALGSSTILLVQGHGARTLAYHHPLRQEARRDKGRKRVKAWSRGVLRYPESPHNPFIYISHWNLALAVSEAGQ